MRTTFPEPARPINGGPYVDPLPLTYYTWWLEPKYNGWRVILDTETQRMYNRHGNRLSKEEAFIRPAEEISDSFDGLVDCEGLGYRHAMGRGTLIALDLMDNDDDYDTRSDVLRMVYPELKIGVVPAVSSVYSAPRFGKQDAPELRRDMEAFNLEWGIIFYEGVVAKENDSSYFYGETSNKWRKYRFTHDS
jgi:hypothetical protein